MYKNVLALISLFIIGIAACDPDPPDPREVQQEDPEEILPEEQTDMGESADTNADENRIVLSGSE